MINLLVRDQIHLNLLMNHCSNLLGLYRPKKGPLHMLPYASKSVKLYPNFNPTQEVSNQNNSKTNQSYIVALENLSTSTSHQDPKHSNQLQTLILLF